MPSILIIEDQDITQNSMRRLLEKTGYDIATSPSLKDATANYQPSDFDLIISDLRLPDAAGTEIIPLAGEVPVIIMTSHASVSSAVAAMKQGAVDYVAKPFDQDDLLLTVKRALHQSQLERQNAALKADLDREYPVDGMIGRCAAMQQVFDRITKVAPTAASVLVLGESGTGKELVARAVHEKSPRSHAPLISVNCAALPDGLVEAELFGHEKGAFTGASNTRLGLVEAASGGTLFLDEIGELPLPAQARLLRMLQEGEIRRVGASTSRRVDVRLIAATHRDLGKKIQNGEFREDLYFRINVMEIRLPPLRDRTEDIPELTHYLLKKVCQRLHRPAMHFAESALAAIQQYSWPGNIRELSNVIERAVILSDGEQITAELLGLTNRKKRGAGTAGPLPDLSLTDYFRRFVLQHQSHLSETELARRLGISRKGLWEKRQRLGIPRPPG